MNSTLHWLCSTFPTSLLVCQPPSRLFKELIVILPDVPSNWIIKRFRAGFYLPLLITCWGIVSTFLGFTKSYGGLIAARFFLGLCEGGLLGGMVVYLAMFYRRHQMLYRIGLFYCAAPLSGAFGGLLATGLAKINYNGYNGAAQSPRNCGESLS